MAIDQIPVGLIKDNAVTTAKILDDNVTGAKIENSPTIAAIATFTGRSVHSAGITIQNGGQIGSASDLDSLTIDASGNVTASQNLTVTGALTVNGTTTTINSTTLTVDDKNIELGSTASPTDSTADGGGITLKGTTDKTIAWENDTNQWNVNQKWTENAGSSAWHRPLTTQLGLS